MQKKMRYRLGLDLGSSSIGWSMIRLAPNNEPVAVIKAGVRIFPDGRNPKDGSSLAVTRRLARGMRRRRDRLLKRKARVTRLLISHGFFPEDTNQRKALEQLDPYEIRARGLDQPLTPGEFARAIFHLNQRRGFKSNRKTDKKDNDSGALKTAIRQLHQSLHDDQCRTVGEWLHRRLATGQPVRARYRETRLTRDDGKSTIQKSYDLYIDRGLIELEFDRLWEAQAKFNPTLFVEQARFELKDALLFQRKLRPVLPGRCTLIPDQERAPLALPSTQRFRILQELNHLRILTPDLQEHKLTLAQRDLLAESLEHSGKLSFDRMRKLLKVGSDASFNFEDPKRTEFKGNASTAVLSKDLHFGKAWHELSLQQQDRIVDMLLNEESEAVLVDWLQRETGVDVEHAEAISTATLPEGYGSLSRQALSHILPQLLSEVIPYSEAVKRAGEKGATFDHHSVLSHGRKTGEILPELPYYGEILQRHIGFADPRATPEDPPEKRFGKIANPTVHIGLNQLRKVVNALITRYGPPDEVVVEVARELKQSKASRDEENRRQAERQRKNERWRSEIAEVLGIVPERVRASDLQKRQLWEELGPDVANRRCPYSGVQISMRMLFSDEVEVEHILPFSMTLDDSMNNKTVAMRQANRVKGNATPWEAFGKEQRQGFDYPAILERAQAMPKAKRYRFAQDGYERWLKEDKNFLARALNDTRYLSRVAFEYISAICPSGTRVIPGQMTAMLRAKFGLNDVLGLNGEKNRNDHRHHAVDACVIAVTDQGLLQRFAAASAQARGKGLDRLVETVPMPWPSYREHVERAISHIWVSHRPDHGYEGAMHNDTAYGLLENGQVRVRKLVDGHATREPENLKVIPMSSRKAGARHGILADGSTKPYKGYKGNSNYCIEVSRDDNGRWIGEVISTFDAYQIARLRGKKQLRDDNLTQSGKPLVMRLMIDDFIRLKLNDHLRTMRVAKVRADGQISLADHHEANVDARNRNAGDSFSYVSKSPGALKAACARMVNISPIGEMLDPGFRE